MLFHPDKCLLDQSESGQTFIKIQDAYQTLKDHENREKYRNELYSKRFSSSYYYRQEDRYYSTYDRQNSDRDLGVDLKLFNLLESLSNSIKTKGFYVILLMFAVFLASIFWNEKSKDVLVSKGYSVYMHHILSKNFKTPANGFDIFVDPNFLGKFSERKRWAILANAEKHHINKIGERCLKIGQELSKLNKEIDEYYSKVENEHTDRIIERQERLKTDRKQCEKHLSRVQSKFQVFFADKLT